jgi:hypothetical protein
LPVINWPRPCISCRKHADTTLVNFQPRSLSLFEFLGGAQGAHEVGGAGGEDTSGPKRGGGTGFEQDILLYEPAPQAADTGLVPRVTAEVKLGSQ